MKNGKFKDPIGVKEKSIKPVQAFGDQPTYESKKHLFMGGDYYGTGIKAKVGKLNSDTISQSPIPQKALRKAPKSLA